MMSYVISQFGYSYCVKCVPYIWWSPTSTKKEPFIAPYWNVCMRCTIHWPWMQYSVGPSSSSRRHAEMDHTEQGMVSMDWWNNGSQRNAWRWRYGPYLSKQSTLQPACLHLLNTTCDKGSQVDMSSPHTVNGREPLRGVCSNACRFSFSMLCLKFHSWLSSIHISNGFLISFHNHSNNNTSSKQQNTYVLFVCIHDPPHVGLGYACRLYPSLPVHH